MACPSLLHSSASLFHGRFPSLATPSSAQVLSPPIRNVVKASASGTVLVDKSEAEKTHRLKTAYLERIIHVLKDEFKYVNIHQMNLFFLFALLSSELRQPVNYIIYYSSNGITVCKTWKLYDSPYYCCSQSHQHQHQHKACSRAPWKSTFVEICSEDRREFMTGLTENIGLGKIDAARMVSAAVAARTLSWFLQAWVGYCPCSVFSLLRLIHRNHHKVVCLQPQMLFLIDSGQDMAFLF